MNAFARKTVIFVAVIAAVAFAGWFGRKAYQKATERRLVAEVSQYLAKQDLRNASLCLQRALQINPLNLAANKLTADMLEEAGSPSALGWRIRAAQLQTNHVEYRFAWAQTALELNDVPSAIQALRGVDEKYRSTAEFHKLTGALAWNLHDPVAAEREYSAALKLEPTNQAVLLNLATVRLVSTNQTVADEARASLEKVPPSSPLHLIAIRYLASDAASHKSYARALAYAQQATSDPKSAYADKLMRLQILRLSRDPGLDSWLASLQQDAVHSAFHAYALGHWMETAESPAVALRWLQGLPAEVQTNLPVPLVITDCQIALKDWPGMLALVGKENWDEFDYYRLALESLADRSLAKDPSAEITWQRAMLLSAHRLDRLTRLDQLSASWQWPQERKEVLQELIAEFPGETWARNQLAAVLYANGETQALANLYEKLCSNDPSNIQLKNNLATVLLLLKTELGKAHRLAQESYDSSPNNPFFACTYAYSLLLQSKPDEALKVVNALKLDDLKNPTIAAYYGVVEAEAGNSNAAREPLKLAEAARILPEEIQLVRRAEMRL